MCFLNVNHGCALSCQDQLSERQFLDGGKQRNWRHHARALDTGVGTKSICCISYYYILTTFFKGKFKLSKVVNANKFLKPTSVYMAIYFSTINRNKRQRADLSIFTLFNLINILFYIKDNA